MEFKSAWLIIAKANLHVGNENVSNCGLIDKAIQRDVVTELPCINSSSLKGAINEYATAVCTQSISAEQRLAIFGSDKKDRSISQKGNSIFFDANILALPRPKSNTLYELVTCEVTLNRFAERLRTFGLDIDKETVIKSINTACGQQPVCLSEKDFVDICSDNELPIIARNYLENGESKNLWYEQILPRETIMGALILSESEALEKVIDKKVIQIGANATIGYGYCEFVKILN